MNQQSWNLKPDDIEARSLAIIDSEAGEHGYSPKQWAIIRRMIHTTADFDWANITMISDEAIATGIKALNNGCTIFTDTQMAQMGISPWRMEPLNVDVRCLISRGQTIARATAGATTRAVAAVDLAVETNPEAIFVIGNAPTALFRLVEHARAGRANPGLIVGLPVGFVNAAESKQVLAESDLSFITARGRKGGSAVAASVINALAIMALENQQ